MFYFNGSACSSCGVALNENDDIVACPVCGSPHHRSCYAENGGCANEALHDEGFEWKRDSSVDEDSSESAENKVNYCGICGAENSAGRMYCHNCGRPLFEDAANANASNSEYSAYNRQYYNFSDDDKIDEIPLGDIKKFLGNAGFMYAPLFYQMHRLGKKANFNLIALLFPAFWFLNRKMYGHSLFIIFYNLLSNCYSLLFYGVYAVMYDAGMSFNAEQATEIFNKYPAICAGFAAFAIGSYIISIVSAIFCNNMYKNWTLRSIRRIRKKAKNDEEYAAALESKGKMSFGMTFLVFLLYFALLLAAQRFVPTII